MSEFPVQPIALSPSGDVGQLDLAKPRAFYEIQDPAYLRQLGARLLVAAQRLHDAAVECRDVLQEWGEVPKIEPTHIDLLRSVPDLLEPDVQGSTSLSARAQ